MQTSPRGRIGHQSHPECAGSRICIREVDLLCPEAVESQKTFIDEREALHKKAFTKWMNSKLQKATPPIEVNDLIEDLRDGHVLLTLMETLFSTQLPREKGKMRFHKLTNLSTALKVLEQNGVKIVGISNYDIADGKSRAILGLVWSIILRFQVQELFQETTSDVKVKDFHVEKGLLGWGQDVLDGYEDIIKLKDFTIGWRNGLAFNAIIHSHKPELFEFDDLLENDNKTNLQHAFDVAQNEFSVPQLLDPSDIDVPKPDKKLIMMYLTSMYDGLQSYTPTRDRKNKKIQLKKEVDAYKSSYSEIILYITQVETIVMSKIDNENKLEHPLEEHKIAQGLTRDTTSHVSDVNDVTLKGQRLIEDGKISKMEQQEIKTQIETLEIRWEKLVMVVSRYSKRCQTALVSQKEQEIQFYFIWIRESKYYISRKGESGKPEDIKKDFAEIENLILEIETKQPEFDRELNQAKELCGDETIDGDVKKNLEEETIKLERQWHQLKEEVLGKQIQLQRSLESWPSEEAVTLAQDVDNVESAPTTTMDGAPEEPVTYEVQVRRLNINVKSPAVSPLNEAFQKKKLQTWKRKHNETRGAINECEIIVKKMKREHDVQSFYDQYQECNQKIRKVDLMVVDTVDHGQNILRDEDMEKDYKAEVERDLENLVGDYDDLLRTVDEKKSEMDEQVKDEESTKRKQLQNWKVTRDELKPKISSCFIVLRNLKTKEVPLDRVELKLHAEKIEACHQQVTSLEPEVDEVIDTGHILLQSHRLDENESRLVTSDIHEIEDQYRTVTDDSTELKMWIDSAMKEEDSKTEEQLTEWRSNRDDLKTQISKHYIVLKGLKEDGFPSEPVQLTLRAKKIEVCYQEVTSLDPEVDRFVDQSNQLLKGGKLDEKEKGLVIRDMKDLDEQYEDLRKESTEMKNEVDELLENQEKKQHDLLKWREWKQEINNRLDDVQNTVEKIQSISSSKNLQTIEESLMLSEVCNKQIKELEPDVNSALDFAHQLQNECPLSEEEKREIDDDVDDIQIRYDKLNEDSSDQHEWLVVYLQEQETSKKDELEKWRELKQNTTGLIDSCRSKLDTLNTDPDVSHDIAKQNAIIKKCQEDLPSIFEEVQSSLRHANSLLADDLLSKDDKDEVQADAEVISNKLRSLQSHIENQKTRLDELLKQNQAEEKAAMKAEKLAKWSQIKTKLQAFLDGFQLKLKDLKSSDVPKNIPEIEGRINRTAGLSEEILAVVPDIQSGYVYGNELLNDDEIDEPEKDRIENEMEVMGDGFKELRNDVNDEHQRLSDLLEEKRKVRGGKYEMWVEQKEKLIGLLDNAKEVVKEMKSKQRPITAEEINEQLDESEDVFQEMAQFLPHVKEGLSFGNQLLEDDDLSEHHKDIIEDDIENLQIGFGGVKKEFEDHQEWLKSLRAEVDEVTPMQQQVSESAVDFDLRDQDMPDERDTQVSSTTIHMKQEPGEHLFVIRQNVTADQYLQLLHDDMTPEEKFEVEKREKLRHWRDLKEKIDELLKRLMDKLNRIKAADPISLKDLIEQQEDAKDDNAIGQAWLNHKECKEEVEGSESMIRESIRLGNDIIDDDDVDEAERERIRGYIATLEIKLRNIHQQANQEEKRIEGLLEKSHPRNLVKEDYVVEEEPIGQQFQEREPDWDGLSKLDDQLVNVPPSPLRLNSVDQTVNLKFFEKGTDEYIMNLEDERTPEERRQAYNEHKLDRWRECEEKLEEFLQDVKERLDRVSVKPRDRDDIMKELRDAKECRENIEEQEDEIVRCLDVSNDILHDDNIDEKDKNEIKAYISELEIQLKVLHRQAVHDEHILENMLIDTPRDQGSGDFADEEAIGAHYRERPSLDIDFPDEDMEKEDAIIHAMFERSEFPEDIFSTLHEDMTPEERKIAEEEKRLEKWRNWQQKLGSLVDRLSCRLHRVKSGVKPKDRKSLHERKDEAQDCKEEIEESEPMIRDALDHADDLLDDQHLDENEKVEIREYISHMRTRLRELHKDAYEEEERLHELLIESHPSKFEIQEFLVEEEPVEQQFHAREGIDFRFEDDHNLHEHIHPHFYKRAKVDIKFEDDEDHGVESSHEEIKKKEPTHEVFTLLFDDLSPAERKEAEKEEKVGRWRDWKDKLDDLVNRLKNKLDRAKTSDLPRDRRAIEDQREDVKDCREEVEHSEPQIRKALDCANDLLDDDDLDEREKEQIRRYIASLEIELKAIQKQAREEEQRLDEILDQTPHSTKDVRVEHLVQEEPVDQQFSERPDWELNLEDEHENETDADNIVHQMFVSKEPTHYYILRLHEDMTPEERKEAEKEEKVGRWRDWKDKLDDLVNRLKNKLDRAKTSDLPRDKRAIEDQREDVKDCREEVEHSEPQIRKALDCANDLLDDDDLDEREKEQIRRYIASLEIELKAIQKQAREEEQRLDEILDQTPHSTKDVRVEHLVQEEPVDQQFSERPDWELNLEDEHENETDADNIVHQMFVSKEPTHYYILRLHEDMTPEERKEAEKEEKVGRWRDWKDKLDDLVNRLKNKLDRAKTSDLPRDKRAIEDQREDVKDCREEVEHSEPQIRKALDCSNDLLDDDDLDEREKEQIRRYIASLEIELKAIQKQAREEEQRLDEILDQTPHPTKDVRVEHLVQEEPVDQQFSERPDWELNLEDEHENETDADNIVHQMFVSKEPTHYYVLRLHEDMTPEERREADQEEKLEDWRKWQDKLDSFVDRVKRKLDEITEQDTPKDKNAIRELRDDATECKEEVEDCRPRITQAVDCASELLEDQGLDDSEKEKIRQYVSDLEVDIRDVYSRACEEEDRLDVLLQGTPHQEKTRYSRPIAQEEAIDPHHRERPGVDFNFDEETSEKHPGEFVHSMFVVRQPIHHYIWTMEDDLEDGERREAKKEEKLERWRNWKDKLDDMLRHLQRKLQRVQSTPKNRSDIQEHQDEAKEIKEDIEESEPYVRKSLVCANELLKDDDLNEEEKEKIKKYITELEIQLKTLYEKADEEHDQLENLLDRSPNSQQKPEEDIVDEELISEQFSERDDWDLIFHEGHGEKERTPDKDTTENLKMQRWVEYSNRLNGILDEGKQDLDEIISEKSPKTQEEVDDQLARTEDFMDRLAEVIPLIKESFEYGNNLLDDEDFSEKDKDIVEKDMEDIGAGLKDAKANVDQHYQRLKELKDQDDTAEDLISMEAVEVVHSEPFEDDADRLRKEAEKETKLSRWRSWREKLEELLHRLKSKLDRVNTRDTINSRKALKEQIHDAKVCKQELDMSRAEVQEALAYAEELTDDNELSEMERMEIKKHISEFNIQLKTLQKQADDENIRLELELDQMDAEKSDKFAKWRKWRGKVRTLLDDLQRKLSKVKNTGTPKNRKIIEENIATIKECEEGLQSSAPETQFALDYGRQLADDDILSDNEQKTVKQETQKLDKELNELKVCVEEQKTRMFYAVEQFDSQRINKLEKWNVKKRTSRLLLDRIRTKVGTLKFKLKPRNKYEIDKRMDELQDYEEELEAVEVEVASCINSGHALLSENNLDKDSSDTVSDDVDQLQEDLSKLKTEIDNQKGMLNKLLEEEDEIKKEKTAKYRDWRKEIQDLIDSLKDKLKRLRVSEKKELKDKEEKKECTDLAKECSRDLNKLQDEVTELKDYGRGMIDDGSLDDQERQLLEKDVDNELNDITKDAEIIQTTLESMYEQQPSSENDHPLMEEWRERVRKVNFGLEVAEDRLDQPSELKNRNEIKEHLEDIKELNISFAESEPQFLETVDLGKELLVKDDVSDENKMEIKEDLVLMTKRWGAFKTKGEDEEDRLHELLIATSESDDLVTWHERCDDMQAWIDDTLSLLETRPVSLSASFGHMKRQQSVTEDVLQDLVEKQVEVNTIIDEGNQLLDDPSCGTDERKDIHDKMMKLHGDWNRLSISLTGRQESIQDALVQLEQQHKDMATTWRKKYGPLRKWISQAQSRLNGEEFAIAPDLDSVKKQRKDIEKFLAEKSSHTSEVNEALQTAEHVLKGPQVDEEQKTVIQGEMQELQHGWEELDESLTWKQNRIEDTIRKLENQREDKLRKWQEGLQQVNKWITKTSENIKPEPKLANNVDSAYDQIDSLQDFVRDAPIYQDKVTNLNEFSGNLLADPCLGEDERLRVRNEMADCNKRWNEFVNMANARQSRLEHNLGKLEKDQDDDFNRWTIRSGRASELLDKFESKMPTVDEPLATQLEDVEKQEREFDVFANQVDLNETQMDETFSLGQDIINDNKYSKSRRDSVQGQLNLLTSRWDRIKDFVDLRKGRLAQTAKRLRESRRKKLEDWEYRSGEFDIFLTNCERDIRSPDTINGDLTSVKIQMEDFKIAMSKVRSQKRKVFEYGQYTDEVIADPIMDNVSRDHIKIEKEARIDRWGHIEDMMNNQQARLKEKLQELQKGQAEMDGWNTRLVNVQTKIKNLEELSSEPIAKDPGAIEEQKRQMKKANQEKDSLDSQVSDFLTSSEDLMDKPGISTEDRRHIDRQCDVLELRWHKAKGELERRDKSLEEKQEGLNKRQKSLLSEWQTRKTEVSVWIADMEQRMKSLDTVAPDVDKARNQYQELKDIQREVHVYEKEVRRLEDLAETMIEDPGIHTNEKGLVTSEKLAIREHWEALNTKAHNVQRKLDDRVRVLENEQNRKLQEWRQKSAPLDDWMNDAETKVESYDPIAYDVKNVQQQNKENELMLKSLHKKQPKFDEVIDFGNVLLKDTHVARDDRNKIQDDMESLQERWENVDDIVAKRHDDIQVRLKELEEEEKERKKKDEFERNRRHERRQKENIEKQKAEEEERKKREEEERERLEEERRRKEYEERIRKEELKRQRLEEELRKREEEDERKRREEEKRQREEEERRKEEERKRKEEEANKYIQMTYEPRISIPFEQEVMLQSEPQLESSPDQWQDSFAEAEAESRERLGLLRDDADSVRRWIKQREPTLDEESDNEDLVGLKEQRKGLTKLENELVEYQPTYDDVSRRSELLAEDQFLNDEDKQALNEDMEDVKTRWNNMATVKEQKIKRVENKISQKEKGKLNDLIDCRADIKNLNDWITNKNNQFDRLSPVVDDLPTLLIQRDELKDFSKDIADHDPKFTECIQSAHMLSKDPALSTDESDVIQNDAEKCEERWDGLNEKVRQRVESIVEQLPPLQRKQKELLGDWDDKLDRFKKSLKKSNNNLDEQRAKWPLKEDKLVSSVDLTDELIERVDQNETVEWRPTIDTSNERLAKIRVKLQRIQRDKKNRKWSFIEAIKGVFGFGRKPKKTGINLDNLIIQFEEHEDLMQEVSSLQRIANEIVDSCNTITASRDVEEHNIMKVDGEMRAVNAQWNTLNFKVIERENRLELLAKEIEDEYQEFDAWRENCETMNQFLKECERQQKEEEKIGTDVETLQAQIKDCQEFKKEVVEYTPQAEKVLEKSQNLIDSGRLDKADMDGVEKTRDVLQNRWKGINERMKTRQDNLDSALLEHIKKDSDSCLWKWRDDSLKLEHTLTDAHRKINSDVDETDFVAINESAEQLQSLESAVDDVFNEHMSNISDSGKDLVGKKTLEPQEEGEVHHALDSLNKRLGDIEKSAQEKKTKIKNASSKYFHRSLSNMSFNANEIEEKMNMEFSDVGADVGEVQKQLANLQSLEDQMTEQDKKLEELKIQLQDSKEKRLLHDDDEQQILDKISKLEITMDRVNTVHDENKKRLTQTLIVLHEELMEEIHDWLNDTEKQVDSIQANQDDIASLREEHTNHSELKEEIASFEPTFNRAISLSRKLLNDQIVDSERAQSYENETKNLNERMEVVNLKTMDNGAKLSNGFAMYLTTRLDDAEVSLTRGETKLTPDDKGYVDLESAKKQLDISKASLGEITSVTKEVDDIVEEAYALVEDGYFKKHEQEHFRTRIVKIASRNKKLGDQANKEYKRQFDTYIVLLRQHLGKMDIWLNKAEARRKATGEIQSGYDRVKKQLEEHQKFQDEIREHSMITLILELDITDPAVNESVQTQVKILSERWASLWRWSEERRTLMLKLMNNWQKFRDEQLVLLNWLSSKEKVLKEMGVTDLSNEKEVTQQLEVLKKMEKQLDEQGLRLQNLHKAGDELLKDVDEHDQASKDIKDQLNEFDECWNSIAKQVIDRVQSLETSQNKLREFRLEMVAVNEWMEETEQIISGFHIDMDSEEATRLQGKLDIKCDERSKYQTRVDRINRHGKDLQGTVDQPSYEVINDELEPFNKRWTKVSEQIENLSDKGYPTPENECCFIRILRRKLGICH